MHVPVLIVGGGPIGLTASVLLSQLGIDNLLVNRRPTTSTHPRARFIDVRTVEILRQMGLADEVIATGLPPEWVDSVRYSTTLAEPEVHRLPTESYHSIPRPYSPTVPVMTAQDLVEPIMLDAARSFAGADVRFGTDLVALAQSGDGCRARVLDIESGAETEVTAEYVIGADGRRSTVRSLLGGGLEDGFTTETQIQDVLYHADMSPWVGDRLGALLFVSHPRGYGLFQPMDGRTRWRAQCTRFTPHIEPADVTEADCVAWIRSAIGDEAGELELDVESIAPWSPEARLSDAFRRGRVFLAGDAAHMLVPTGGYGMNLGYHGVHNLAWKLAFVLRGLVRESILDTYEIERRAQSDRTRVASIENGQMAAELYRTHHGGGDLADVTQRLRQYGNFEGMILAPEYDSRLCVPDGDPAPVVDNEITDLVPVVRSGRRAPHVWLDGAQTQSVLDWFGREYVVLAAGVGDEAVARQAAALRSAGFPISVRSLPDATLGDLYRSSEHVVVRPDGVVAARIAHGEPLDLAELVMAA